MQSRHAIVSRVLLSFTVLGLLASVAGAVTIRSWNGTVQRGGDLFNAVPGSLGYGTLSTTLSSRGHAVLPGLAVITPADLVGVDVFFSGTNSHVVTAAEGSALLDFVSRGGCLILEANSATSEQAAGNSILAALGLGSHYTGNLTSTNDANAGVFAAVAGATTVGPLGDLRGLSYASSMACELTPGDRVVGVIGNQITMTEFTAPGHVLVVGDPYGFDLFNRPTESLYNPNNLKAYLNFIENCSHIVPTRSSTWGSVKTYYR